MRGQRIIKPRSSPARPYCASHLIKRKSDIHVRRTGRDLRDPGHAFPEMAWAREWDGRPREVREPAKLRVRSLPGQHGLPKTDHVLQGSLIFLIRNPDSKGNPGVSPFRPTGSQTPALKSQDFELNHDSLQRGLAGLPLICDDGYPVRWTPRTSPWATQYGPRPYVRSRAP